MVVKNWDDCFNGWSAGMALPKGFNYQICPKKYHNGSQRKHCLLLFKKKINHYLKQKCVVSKNNSK